MERCSMSKQMRKQLVKLLGIHGVSGDEGKVRDYLKPILTQKMDEVEVDSYGNLLATKKIGDGNGATILLSAHMDTVRGVVADRQLIEKDGVISSSRGALGADDRAGIAVILEVLRNIEQLSFTGTLKIAFSREEEIGCVGASKIDTNWYKDVDLAIVVDRRGNRDVVVGCYQAFCSDAVGNFFEEVSKMQGMDWKAVEGGVSDAMTFSKNGINSVNLSVGYRNEHTDKEYVVLEDMRDTVRLIMQALAVVNTFYGNFGKVPSENKWVKSYDYGYSKYDKYGYDYSKSYTESYANYYEEVYAEAYDQENGDTFIYEVGDEIVIQQGDAEIFLSRESMKTLFDQLKNTLSV